MSIAFYFISLSLLVFLFFHFLSLLSRSWLCSQPNILIPHLAAANFILSRRVVFIFKMFTPCWILSAYLSFYFGNVLLWSVLFLRHIMGWDGRVSWGCQQTLLEFLISQSVTKYALPCGYIWPRSLLLPSSSSPPPSPPLPRDEVSTSHKEGPQLMGPLIVHLMFVPHSCD